MMNTATLLRCVRDPHRGEVHLPSEEVTIVGVIRPAPHSDEGEMAGWGRRAAYGKPRGDPLNGKEDLHRGLYELHLI
jgi:hypothetical protein